MPQRTRDLSAVSSRRPLQILLVEDQPALGKSLSQYLRMRRHVVIRVTDLKAARTALDERSFDVLMADVQLPKGQCFELLNEELRLPQFIITMSGFDEEKSPTPVLARGARHHLVKPFAIEHLDALLESFVSELAHVPPGELPDHLLPERDDTASEPELLPPVVTTVLREIAHLHFVHELSPGQFEQRLSRLTRNELAPRGCELHVEELPDGSLRFAVKDIATQKLCEMLDVADESRPKRSGGKGTARAPGHRGGMEEHRAAALVRPAKRSSIARRTRMK